MGFKTSASTKMVTYDAVAPARPAVAIHAGGDWIVNYSKSTFVGFRTSSSSKMVTYPRRDVPGDVAIDDAWQWVATGAGASVGTRAPFTSTHRFD